MKDESEGTAESFEADNRPIAEPEATLANAALEMDKGFLKGLEFCFC